MQTHANSWASLNIGLDVNHYNPVNKAFYVVLEVWFFSAWQENIPSANTCSCLRLTAKLTSSEPIIWLFFTKSTHLPFFRKKWNQFEVWNQWKCKVITIFQNVWLITPLCASFYKILYTIAQKSESMQARIQNFITWVKSINPSVHSARVII